MTATLVDATESVDINRLHDRCDRCGSAAYTRVEKDGLPLFFCGHHFHKYELGLMEAGFKVILDNRKELERPCT